MKTNNFFKRALAIFLTAVMLFAVIPASVIATENGDAEPQVPTNWLGDSIKMNIEAGSDAYNYMIIAYKPDTDVKKNFYYYETSNHTLKKEVTGGGAVHLIPIVDTNSVQGEWTPDGIYDCGESNFDVVYCCDAATPSEAGIYYKRLNLEDSEYYSVEQAEQLRAILTHSYPFVTVAEAKAFLEDAGFEQADELDRSELISATQAAVWSIANKDNGDSFAYNKTASTAQKLTWGGYMHDFAPEIVNFKDSITKRSYSTPEGVGARIDALKAFLLDLEPVKAEDDQIVITKIDVKNSKLFETEDKYEVELNVELNHAPDENDDIVINAYIGGETVATVEAGEDKSYTIKLTANANDNIKVVLSGTQDLAKGVYFYAPKPQDVDGDGIATSRELSQNLIGVSMGTTPVYAEKNITVDVVNVDLEINKVDADGQPLEGARFAIYTEDDILVDAKDVDENGKLVFESLVPGTYSLKETVAPYGYALLEDAIEVKIMDDGSVTFDGEKLMGDKITSDPIESNVEPDKSADVVIDLVPGGETESTNEVVVTDNAAKIITAIRKVTAKMTEVEVNSKTTSTEFNFVQSDLKFDRNDLADQKQQKIDRELYTDNGHFHDPSTITVTDAPEGYPFQYVGNGDYSGHYVSHVNVVYARDDAGNALKDENGNYIIDHLEHAGTGTPLYYNNELVTNPDGPFHFATGTRPQQFLLMNEAGDTVYAYCIDLGTGAESGKWYAIANIEDNDYYASEEAENHIRNIVMNGYWGTASGEGSLASLKEALKTAVANGVVDKEYDVTLVNRKKFATGYELKEGEYHHGNYVYWTVIPVDGEDHVVLTDDVIDGLTEGEALDAMQAAIWSWANGSNANLNGIDRHIVGDLYASSSQLSDSLNAKNDYAGAARTKALYHYLMSLDAPQESTVVINDKTFAENMNLTVGNKIADGIYKAALSFSLPVELSEQDDLTVALTYADAYGETKTIEVALTGEGAIEAVNGIYTIDGLALRAGEEFKFSLNIYGGQYLEKNAYILVAQGGIGASQTMVTLAEGVNTVDVTKSASVTFEVEDTAYVSYNRYFYSASVVNEPIPETSEPETSEPETSEPETSEPETSEPETSEPETSEPETSEPETSEPETSEPETSEPETSEPETSEPETSEPETSEPETSEPEETPDIPEETPDIPEDVIDDPEVPLAPSVPEDTEEPEEEPETEDEFVEIEDPEVPLAPEAPQTGSNALFSWLVVAAVSGTLFTFDVFRRRRAAADR